MSEEIRNDACRRCKYLKERKIKDTIYPIYYCKKHKDGIDHTYMNRAVKEEGCFKKKVTGPWRMPEGMYEMDEFVKRIVYRDDEYYEDEKKELRF